METTKTDNELIAEFMGFPKVTVGSSWDYNRHFDHASITRNLIVKEVDDVRNAEFEQKMPFTKYGLDAFDGIIFRPSGYPDYSLSKFHCPARPYHTSWDWLMPACRKWDNLNYDSVPKGAKGEFKSLCDALDNLVSMYEIEPVFRQLCINIRWYNKWYNKWYNQQTVTPKE